MKTVITLAFTGDVMLGRGVNEVMAVEGPDYPLGNVAPLLREADLALINLECVISDRGTPWLTPPRAFYFRAAPSAMEVLKRAGIDYVTLANNHVLDFGYEALEDTFKLLEAQKIPWAGAGRNLEEAKRPAILKTHGLTLAVFGATDNSPEYGASDKKPGTWYLEIPPPEPFFEELGRRIKELRKEGVDLVVFSIHWGPNMRTHPPEEFQAFARRLVDLGVDIFHGTSAHVFQGIEIYKGKIIFYDTGDFVDDYWVSMAIDEQFLYKVLVDPQTKRLRAVELVPVKIASYQVNLADSATARRTVERMRQRSNPFGTKIMQKEDKWVIDVKS